METWKHVCKLCRRTYAKVATGCRPTPLPFIECFSLYSFPLRPVTSTSSTVIDRINMEELVAKLGAESVNNIHAAALVRRFVNDIPPKAEPVQDYLTDADTRRVLFDEFRATCQELDPLQFDPPHATILAVFMVAPVSEIRTQLCARLSACLQAFNHSLRTGHVGCDEKQVCRSSTCHVYSLLPPSPRYLLTEARSWTEMGTLVCFLAHRTQRQRTFFPSRQAKGRLSGT